MPQVNCFCFDKTGTLTSDGLELACMRPVLNTSGSPGPRFSPRDITSRDELPPCFVSLLASCHALTHVGGTLTGDPLEVKTFAFTGATLDEPHHAAPAAAGLTWAPVSDPVARVIVPGDNNTIPPWRGTVLCHFDFVPALRRMGVLVIDEDGGGEDGVTSFVKGSPETLASLCDPASLPADFWPVLGSYTHQGYRVLGAGFKRLPASTLPPPGSPAWAAPELRAAAETNLTFLGLIVLENQLKPASRPAIAALRSQGSLALAMITGDNADAAVCVGRKCELVEPGYRVYVGDLAPTAVSSLASPQARLSDENAEDESLMEASAPRMVATPASSAMANAQRESSASIASGGTPCPQATVSWTDVDDAARKLDPLLLTPVAEGRGVSAANPEPYRLALTGRAFAVLLDAHRRGDDPTDVFRRAILNGAVFARMSPEAKAALVEEYQATGLYVGMVGDGANDSLALRSAHVGISLSEVGCQHEPSRRRDTICVLLQAEASVSAPFTSRVPDISCVARVLCEGRGALATSFCLFQLSVGEGSSVCLIGHDFYLAFSCSMALYSTIQFVNALLAVWNASFLSNNEYMWQVRC